MKIPINTTFVNSQKSKFSCWGTYRKTKIFADFERNEVINFLFLIQPAKSANMKQKIHLKIPIFLPINLSKALKKNIKRTFISSIPIILEFFVILPS